MPRCCCAPLCTLKQEVGGISLFSFPKNDSLRKKWTEQLGISDVPSRLPELDSLEANAFFFLVGYCLNAVKNTCSLCDLCFSEVQSLNPGRDGLPAVYTYLRDYKGDALIYPSRKVYDMLYSCETHFRLATDQGLLDDTHPRVHMLQIFRKLAETVTFSPCHNIKDKIIRRFVHIRLRIHARKMKYVVKEQVSEKEAQFKRKKRILVQWQ